ncbi:MAG: tetratricopeptide repeat protein [Planctomycetes bacterium]|nr:tetratricopeptide repeat protein [Planctomycetota bacterium]
MLHVRSRKFVLALLFAAVALIVAWRGPWAAATYCRSRGVAALESHHEELASEWFHRAESFEPQSGHTQFLLARTCRHRNEYEQAGRYLERAVALGFPRERAEREQWLALAQFGRTDQLGPRLDILLADPGEDEREILSALANGLTNSLDLDSANAVLAEWMKRYPNDSDSYACAGQFRQALGEWPKAIELYRKSLQLLPERDSVRLSLAQCLASAREPAAAEQEYRQVLRRQPDRIEVVLGLGACLVDLGRVAAARQILGEALRLDPVNFDAARLLGELELSQDQVDEAVKILRPLAERWPHDIQVCTLMSRALREAGELDQSQAYSQEVERARAALQAVEGLIEHVKRERADVSARYQIGKLLLDHQSREQGVGWLQSVLLYDPEHGPAHSALARYYESVGNVKLAEFHRSHTNSTAEGERDL